MTRTEAVTAPGAGQPGAVPGTGAPGAAPLGTGAPTAPVAASSAPPPLDIGSTSAPGGGAATPALVEAGPAAAALAPVPARSTGSPWPGRLTKLASVLAAIGVWQLLTVNDVRLWLRFDTLPTVTEILTAFGRQLGTDTYFLDLAQSLIRILSGFGLATAAGVLTGIALGRSRRFANVVGPLTELARPVPAIAVVPIAILLFPDDEAGIVFITFLAAYFPIMVSTRHAVRALPTLWEDSVRTLGGSRWDVLLRVVFPGSLPGVFGGLSVGIGVAWICVISAEMISGRLGVGYRTWQAYTIVDYPGVFVGIITIGVLGFGTSAAVELLGRRVTRWLPRGAENAR